jgi:hypothetical protein
MRWTRHVACTREWKGAYKVSVGKPDGNRPLGRSNHRLEDNTKMDFKELRCSKYKMWGIS